MDNPQNVGFTVRKTLGSSYNRKQQSIRTVSTDYKSQREREISRNDLFKPSNFWAKGINVVIGFITCLLNSALACQIHG